MKRTLLMFALLASLAGCDQQSDKSTDIQNARREPIQGFQTTIYRVHDGKQRWIEIEIAVDGDKKFRMPVFFADHGRLVEVGDDEARKLVDTWLKRRAENVAAFGSFDPQSGLNGPFLAIDRNRP